MNRRQSIALFAVGMLELPTAIWAQPTTRTARIGFLASSTAEQARPRLAAFQRGLRELGHVEGRGISIEARYAGGDYAKLPSLAAELVGLNVDVLVTEGTPAAQAAKAATSRIPVVVGNTGDPVGTGLVASLAHPGANITGLSDFSLDLVTKRLELVREIAPTTRSIGFLFNPGNPTNPLELKQLQEAAAGLKLTLLPIEIAGTQDFDAASATIASGGPGALLIAGDSALRTQQPRIFDLATKQRLAALYPSKLWASAGGLMSFGTNFDDLFRRAAGLVHKILLGAKPAEIPVEQPTAFELVVNLKTARAQGFAIPKSILARADEVIE